MYVLTSRDWSATTWVLLFIAMMLMVLCVLVGLVVVLVRAAGGPDEPRSHDPDRREQGPL